MKNRGLLISLAVLPLVAMLIVIVLPGKSERSYSPRINAHALSIVGAAEFWATIRNNQETRMVDPADVQRAMLEIKQMSSAKTLSFTWDEMGPDNLGGRTRAILFDKNDPSLIYAGAVSGGLWKSATGGSSWVKVASVSETMIIGAIAQAPNGDIYVGTGEGFGNYSGGGTSSSPMFPGIGIYKSTDGENFSLLPSTTSWKYINELAVNQSNGYVYAGTSAGLKISNDGGATWGVAPTFSPAASNSSCEDIEIASDGTVIIALNKNCFIAANGVDFVRSSGTGYTLPTAGSRMELAVAPSDPNYIYAVLAATNGTTQGIWRTIDKGANWTQIGPATTTTFNIHADQGWYNNTIAVYPNDKNKILVGGIDLWTWTDGGTWLQVTSGNFSHTSPLYVHVDIHELKFHPTNPDVIFLGCDGGIHRSINGGLTWAMMNKNYSTVQYYAITSSGSQMIMTNATDRIINGRPGMVLGGTQDNSYQFIDLMGNTARSARTLWGGDGGYGAISMINPEAYFVSAQYGSAGRTADDGKTWKKAYKGTSLLEPEFFNRRMLLEGTPGTNWGSFVTVMRLWESVTTYDAKDSILFIADTNYVAGEVITVRGPHHGYPFNHTLLAGLQKEDSMMIQNPIQSMFIIASRTGLWMTRNPLDFSTTPTWFKIGTTTGGVIQTLTISEDGDHAYIGTTGGTVFRFSNLRQAYDSLAADMTSSQQVITRTSIGSWSGRAVTSIAVDPFNSDHVVVTLGNYGNTVFIYRTTDALSATPNWVAKMGSGTTKLPAMPVYASLITMHDPNRVIVGTEFGTYMTDNIAASNPVWSEINMGMDRVPTLMLHQQTRNFPYTYVVTGEDAERVLYEYMPASNYGAIYAGTHGRGAFRNLNFVSVANHDIKHPSLFRSQLLIYPNPVNDRATAVINLRAHAKTTVNIFDLSGKVVGSIEAGNLTSGRNELSLDLSNLKTGNYIIQVIAGGESKTAKIIKK
jgi:hypothetical protein